jgi:hypothetical protein
MKTISAALLGAPLDPFSSQTRQHIALVAFLAWIGLGADGLSSSCYGPEEAFLALGEPLPSSDAIKDFLTEILSTSLRK